MSRIFPFPPISTILGEMESSLTCMFDQMQWMVNLQETWKLPPWLSTYIVCSNLRRIPCLPESLVVAPWMDARSPNGCISTGGDIARKNRNIFRTMRTKIENLE